MVLVHSHLTLIAGYSPPFLLPRSSHLDEQSLVMSDVFADPSKSEPSIYLRSNGGCQWLMNDLVEFPPIGHKNLIRLGEDLLHVYPIWCECWEHARNDQYVSSVSAVISRETNPPTDLSPAEATALAETFREVVFPRHIPSQSLTPLAIRPYPDGVTRVPFRTRGPGF